MPADVFISYSSNDQDRVVKLADKLRSAGVSIWVDESGIGAATLWSKEIAGAIKGCKVLILMVTPNSVKSENVVKEVTLAAEQRKKILPVVLEPTQIPEALEYHLAGIQNLDVSGRSTSESAEEVLPALQRLLGMETEEANAPATHTVRLSRRRSLNIWTDWKVYAFGIMTAALVWILKPVNELPLSPAPRHTEVILQGRNPLQIYTVNAFAISPDARSLVYGGNEDSSNLRLRYLDTRTDVEIQGTQEGYAPFFSPDGKSIGFFRDLKIWQISLDSGKPIALADITTWGRGASWSEKGTIVFVPDWGSGLKKVSENGGDALTLTTLAEGEQSHRWPQCLPGGKYVLFMVITQDKGSAGWNGGIEVADIDTGQRFPLPSKEGYAYARYAMSGHLLYVKDTSLFATPFDLNKLEITGKPHRVLNDVSFNERGAAQYDVANDGTFLYLPGSGLGTQNRTIAWLNTDGTTTPLADRKTDWGEWLSISPNENRVALQIDNDIWIYEIDRDLLRRFTTYSGLDSEPVWSPDGDWIYFSSVRSGKPGIYKKKTDFSITQPELIFKDALSRLTPQPQLSLSPDGKYLTFVMQSTEEMRFNIWSYLLQEEDAQAKPMTNSKFNDYWPMVSPNGKWLAYNSNESGKDQIYVKLFNAFGSVIQVTTDGGFKPRWSKKGDRLFYVNNRSIWSVPVPVQDDVIQPGKPEEIVPLPRSSADWQWDISSDEKRFLVVVADEDETDIRRRSDLNTVNVIFNWFTELNEKVSVGKE